MNIDMKTYHQACKIICSAGILTTYSAYDYFCLAVCLVDEDESQLTLLTKSVYPTIARMRGISSSNVQRNMQTALAAAWKNRQDSLQKLMLRVCGGSFKQKPTPGEFISLAVLILALEREKSF